MINTVLITGCSQGLGHTLTHQFSKLGCTVYAVSRQKNLLINDSPNIFPIQADISTTHGRSQIKEVLTHQKKAFSIIHNAAIAQPQQFSSMNDTILRKHLETNLIAPLLLTRDLLPLLGNEQRVLNISSGAANLPLPGLLPYCISKAAMQLATHCLEAELGDRGIHFANLRPGMVNTSMQTRLREADPIQLPNRNFYIETKNSGKLIQPETAARFIAWVMLQTEKNIFSQNWDIHDSSHHSQWLLLKERSSLYE